MTLNEKQELANLLESMGVSHRDTLNRDTLTSEQYEDAQIKFRETYFKTLDLVENIKCSDDNKPHNFTPDVENIEEHIHFGKWFWDKSKNYVPLDFKTYFSYGTSFIPRNI